MPASPSRWSTTAAPPTTGQTPTQPPKTLTPTSSRPTHSPGGLRPFWPPAGALTLPGGAVRAGQTVAVTDIPNLVFPPVADANGSGYASFTFQVVDDGGPANSGVNTDQSANT